MTRFRLWSMKGVKVIFLVEEVEGGNSGVTTVVICHQLVALSYSSLKKGNPIVVRWWLSLLLLLLLLFD